MQWLALQIRWPEFDPRRGELAHSSPNCLSCQTGWSINGINGILKSVGMTVLGIFGIDTQNDQDDMLRGFAEKN